MQDFRELKMWKRALVLTKAIYKASATFPSVEQHGLVSQMRSAAVSIMSNIAEGRGRGSDADFARFLRIAMGSTMETHSCVIISAELGFLTIAQRDALETEISVVRRILLAFIGSLRRS